MGCSLLSLIAPFSCGQYCLRSRNLDASTIQSQHCLWRSQCTPESFLPERAHQKWVDRDCGPAAPLELCSWQALSLCCFTWNQVPSLLLLSVAPTCHHPYHLYFWFTTLHAPNPPHPITMFCDVCLGPPIMHHSKLCHLQKSSI